MRLFSVLTPIYRTWKLNCDIDNEEIEHTEEIRSILKGMEYLCDDIDDLKEN